MRSSRGFSLLELLIVVAIILIVTTIAVPSLLRSRQSANETAAVATLRQINTAQLTYSSSWPSVYGTIDQLVSAGLLDSSLQSTKAGYNYAITLSSNSRDYTATAIAVSTVQGRYDYYTIPDYVVRYSTDSTRSPSSLSGSPVQ
jgi:prepilin-type N-terminal cleavage/methylation domain-containing protein